RLVWHFGNASQAMSILPSTGSLRRFTAPPAGQRGKALPPASSLRPLKASRSSLHGGSVRRAASPAPPSVPRSSPRPHHARLRGRGPDWFAFPPSFLRRQESSERARP